MSKPMLAAAGIVFLVTAIIGFIWVIYAKRKLRRAPPPEIKASPPVPAVTLRGRYNTLYMEQAVPPNARLVTGAAFSPDGEAVCQYCWLTMDELVFMPLWESVEELFRGMPPESAPLFAIRIPLGYVDCYFEEQSVDGKYTALQYKSPQGTTLLLGFSQDAIHVFNSMLPDFARDRRFERQYTRSMQNIQDINEVFLRLKELRRRDLISEEEYAEKKKQILIKM